jgi:hypothetical protein
VAALYPTLSISAQRWSLGAVTGYGDFTATLEDVFWFEADETFVCGVRLENHTDAAIAYCTDGLGLQVGREVFRAVAVEASGAIPAHGLAWAWLAIPRFPQGCIPPLGESCAVIVIR